MTLFMVSHDRPSRGRAVRPALFVAVAGLSLAPFQAQAQTGGIRIEVKDPSGAVMEASGKVENIASGVSRTFRTDPKTPYEMSGLPFGVYKLEVSQAGFRTQTEVVEVDSAGPVEKTISLAIGTGAFQLNVVGVTPLGGVGFLVGWFFLYECIESCKQLFRIFFFREGGSFHVGKQ